MKNLSTIYNLLSTNVISWVKANRVEAMLLSIILLTGAFLRLYRIDEYMTFLGDEGRDVILVRRLLVHGDLILIGPGTSIGDMYLCPLYYYMMAPALLLANFSPVGPAIMIALLGVATIFFVWYVTSVGFPTFKGENLQGRVSYGIRQGVHSINFGALVAASLYATAPVAIIYSRSSWNPNIMPFFALLTIYSVWKWWSPFAKATEEQAKITKNFKWLIVLGISYAFVLQSHYLGLLLAPVIGFFWLLTYFSLYRLPSTGYRLLKKSFIRYSAFGLGLFLLLMSPLLVFDARHDWRNFTAMNKFFSERQTTVSARPWTAIPELPEIVTQSVSRLIAGTNEVVGKWVTIISVFVVLIVLFIKLIKRKFLLPTSYILLLVWLGFAFLGLALYKQHIYDHYYGFFFPALFLLIGGLSQYFIDYVRNKSKFLKMFLYLFLLTTFYILLTTNLSNNPLKYPPNRQLQRAESVAQKIIAESNEKKVNLAVIAERNYEDGYQYFLERWNVPFVEIDPQRLEETIGEYLFVVCEFDDKQKCDPTHSPKAEIANFGWSKIEGEWEVNGAYVYKLSHTI